MRASNLLVISYLVISLCAPVSASEQDEQDAWANVAAKLKESVVYIETDDGSCSGFVIDNTRDYVLTAAHCDGKNLYADSTPVKIKSKDRKSDLMVLYVEDLDKPALSLSTIQAQIGEEVGSLGYGWGLQTPMFRVGHISDTSAEVPDLDGGPFVLIDAAFVPGQSGCPVVNAKGEVVSIVQKTSDRVGVGQRLDKMRDKVGKYFAQAVK